MSRRALTSDLQHASILDLARDLNHSREANARASASITIYSSRQIRSIKAVRLENFSIS